MEDFEYVVPFESIPQSLDLLLKEVQEVVTNSVPRHLKLLLSKDGITRTVSFNIVMPMEYPKELLGPPGITSGSWTVISRDAWETKVADITWGGYSADIRTQLINSVMGYFPENDVLAFVDVGRNDGVLLIASGIMLLTLIEEESPVQ